MTYCGRTFSEPELEAIRTIIREGGNRASISRRVCESLRWLKPDGALKQMSCRVALLRMQADALIELPPPRNGNGNGRPYERRSAAAEPGAPLSEPAGALADLHLEPVRTRARSRLWNEYVQRYHYLGFQPLPGAQMRYFACSGDRVLALLGFGAAAWKTAPRDLFIGWSHQQRRCRLHLIVNNARFLILPWIRSPHLASRLLGMAARRLPADWQHRYGYRPVLLETFVEKRRFAGTSYKAANWRCLGDTQGRGKLDRFSLYALPVKSVWVYPLHRRFREILCAPPPRG